MSKDFKKGEEVIAITKDKRLQNEKMIVESVGRNYITCIALVDGEKMGRPIRFDKETLVRTDWSCYVLYKSEEDYWKEIRRGLRAEALKREIDNLSLEQIDEILNKIREERI